MIKNTLRRGFTLIELLVVIAIIGILASVVLASLNSARDKGEDAAIKSNLNNLRAQAELSYDERSRSYGYVCDDAATLVSAIESYGGNCENTESGWAASAPLNSAGSAYWCVDYRGVSASTSAALASDDITCN